MSEIKYEGKAVNGSINDLTSVGNRFQPVSSQTKSKTGVMMGCKGFDHIASLVSPIGEFGSFNYSGIVNYGEQCLSQLVGDLRVKQIKILDYSGSQNDIDDFVDSLSAVEYYALKDSGNLAAIDDRISGWDKFKFGAKNVFSTACTFALSLGEGVLDFVESVGDGVITICGSAVSGVASLVGADEVANSVSDWTRATVAYDVTGSAFDSLYANTEFGQYLQNNSTGFDTARSIGTGVGYAAGVIVASVFCPAVGMTAFAASAGFGNAAERSYADGATLGKGFAYATASAAWEAAQWAIGANVTGKVAGAIGKGASTVVNSAGKIFPKAAASALKLGSKIGMPLTRMGLEGVDAAAEGFVQPALKLIYKDYGKASLAEEYGAAFIENGGMETVMKQFTTGFIMAGVGEAGSVFRTRRGKAPTQYDSDFRGKEKAAVDGTPITDVDPTVRNADGTLKSDVDPTVRNADGTPRTDVDPTVRNADGTPRTDVDPTLRNADGTSPKRTITQRISDGYHAAKKRVDDALTTTKKVVGKAVDGTAGVVLDYAGRAVDHLPASRVAEIAHRSSMELDQHGFDDLAVLPTYDEDGGSGFDLGFTGPTGEYPIGENPIDQNPTEEYRVQGPPATTPVTPPADIAPITPTVPIDPILDPNLPLHPA